MSDYHKSSMCFAPAQIKKLASGLGVRVPNKHLTGDHVVHLTQRQLNKVAKCKKMGCGMVLRFSKTQLAHNKRSGGSIGEFLKKYGKMGFKYLAPIAIDALSNVASKKYASAAPVFEGISSVLKKKVKGLGAKRVQRKVKGKGWLSWLTEPLGDAAKDIVKPLGEIAKENPELTQMAMQAGMRAAMGKGIKKGRGRTEGDEGNVTRSMRQYGMSMLRPLKAAGTKRRTAGFFGVKDILGMGVKKTGRKKKRVTGASFIPPGYGMGVKKRVTGASFVPPGY